MNESDAQEAQVEVEPDYYVEKGRVVFTAAYHLRRGHCCGSGCRHCPYEGAEKRDRPVDAAE